MNKQQALEELAKYLPPDRLYQIVQVLAPEMLAVGDIPIKQLSYREAQRRRLCPYCGDVGILYSGPERDDADFQAYQCSNLHIFYVDKAKDGQVPSE